MEFIVTRYEISSDRIREPITCALITDLHNKVYGSDNSRLIDSVRSESPDLILCAGDLIVGTDAKPKYAAYVTKLKREGIHLLNNKCEDIVLGSTKIHIAGLEVSLEKYIKFRKPHCDISYIENKIGKVPSDGSYTILMAHNPEFHNTYGEWGADLTVSGHYHGGVVRSPFTGKALLSPYGYPFPKFGVGIKELASDRYIVASAGLGDHSIPLRIFDPRELVVIRITPKPASLFRVCD